MARIYNPCLINIKNKKPGPYKQSNQDQKEQQPQQENLSTLT
jgi:hypothetical protein